MPPRAPQDGGPEALQGTLWCNRTTSIRTCIYFHACIMYTCTCKWLFVLHVYREITYIQTRIHLHCTYSTCHVHTCTLYISPSTQCEVLQKAHDEQKIAVTAAQKALQKAKDRREEMEREIDRMRDEIAAWYKCNMCCCIRAHATCMLQVSTCMLTPVYWLTVVAKFQVLSFLVWLWIYMLLSFYIHCIYTVTHVHTCSANSVHVIIECSILLQHILSLQCSSYYRVTLDQLNIHNNMCM